MALAAVTWADLENLQLPQETCLVKVFLSKGTKQHIDVVVLILDPWMFCLEF